MMKVRLFIAVGGAPCLLSVASFNGVEIFREIINTPTAEVCFFSCEKNIIVSASPLGGSASYPKRYLKLGSYDCCELYLYFADRSSGEEKEGAFQALYLNDLDYGFPIPSATLYLTDQ